jgi:excisionase family DNA binding protein
MRLLDVRAAAELLNISESMIYKLAASRELTCVKIGDCIRFKDDDIDNFIQEHTKRKEEAENEQSSYLF